MDAVTTASAPLVADPNGDVAIAGFDNESPFVLGYTSDGDLSWTNVWADLYAYEIASDVDGNFVVAGLGFGDAMIRKIDADGNELWTQTYNSGGSQNDESRSVATDSTGRIFVVGETEQSDGDGSYDAWIRAYAP